MTTRVEPAGPVDVAVIGFVGERPDRAFAEILVDGVTSGAVRVLDALLVEKSAAGQVRVVDVDDSADALAALGFPVDLPGLLSESDASEVAAELPPDSSAVIVVWENTWAVRVHRALADVGAVVALHERVTETDLGRALAAVSNPSSNPS